MNVSLDKQGVCTEEAIVTDKTVVHISGHISTLVWIINTCIIALLHVTIRDEQTEEQRTF